MQLSELKNLHISQLLEMATESQIENANRMRKQELIFALLKNRAKKGESIYGDGTLEVLPDGFGFLRSPDTSYLASADDIYVSPSQIRRSYRLRGYLPGDWRDFTRPEIPLHSFGPPPPRPGQRGIAFIESTGR